MVTLDDPVLDFNIYGNTGSLLHPRQLEWLG